MQIGIDGIALFDQTENQQVKSYADGVRSFAGVTPLSRLGLTRDRSFLVRAEE